MISIANPSDSENLERDASRKIPENQAKVRPELLVENTLSQSKLVTAKTVSYSLPNSSFRSLLLKAIPPFFGIALLVLIWSIIAVKNTSLPSPWVTLIEAIEVFSDPFYQTGPNDQGIGWNIYASLKRVAVGFGLAAAGLPIRALSRRFNSRATTPAVAPAPAAPRE